MSMYSSRKCFAVIVVGLGVSTVWVTVQMQRVLSVSLNSETSRNPCRAPRPYHGLLP